MKVFFTYLMLFILPHFSNAQIKFVTQVGAGLKDGTSWANAWNAKIFADTINTVAAGTQVWIAKGTYQATKDSLGNIVQDDHSLELSNHERTFMVPSGVKLFGGFYGTENNVQERNMSMIFGQNETILDGGHPNFHYTGPSNNWHLITLVDASANTEVNGFFFINYSRQAILIRSTINSSSSPLIDNCNFGLAYYNAEGAIIINTNGSAVSHPRISRSYFIFPNYNFFIPVKAMGNSVTEISNCLFMKDYNQLLSISMVNSKGGSITNCTFYNYKTNYYPQPDIVISNLTDSVFISNSVFRNDGTPAQGYISHLGITGNNYVSMRNCNLQTQTYSGSALPAYQSGGFSANPFFKDSLDLDGADNIWGTTDDGLQLKQTSSSVDRGINNYLPSIASYDILYKDRVSGCRADVGAYEFQIPNNNLIVLPQSTVPVCTQYPVPDSVTTFIDPATCTVSATINPNGANPLSGIVQVCVVSDANVSFVNGKPYVQRHYNIEPLANASSSTAKITVYYTQQEFDNYNVAAGSSFPHLPISGTDAAGKSHIFIEQDHGTSLTSIPGSYNGSTVFIDPDDSDIIWDNVNNIWKVSFNVNGFSGFFLTTALQTLPVKGVSFSAYPRKNSVELLWQISTAYLFKHFEIEKSNDRNNFVVINTQDANGNADGHQYTTNDFKPNNGDNYYRLVMTDVDGNKTYSEIILVRFSNKDEASFHVFPNPAHLSTTLSISGNPSGVATITLSDTKGNKVASVFCGEINTPAFNRSINIEKYAPGIYFVNVTIGTLTMYQKLIIK